MKAEKGLLALLFLAMALSVGARLFSYRDAGLLDGETVIPFHEPDVFYHMKRIEALFQGDLGILFRDGTLNYPCEFAAPWPWGFDGLFAAILSLVNLGHSSSSEDLFLQSGTIVVGLGVLLSLLLALLLIRLGNNPRLGVLVTWGLSFFAPFLAKTHFGAVDNQLADTLWAISLMLLLSGKAVSTRPLLCCLLLLSSYATSDVSLLLCMLVLTGRAALLLGGQVAQVASERFFFYSLALGTVAFLFAEHALGLVRSYESLRFLLVSGLASLIVFSALVELRLIFSPWSRWACAAALAAFVAVCTAFSTASTLAVFFAGKDGVTEQIIEATPGWVYYSPFEFLAMTGGTALGLAFVLRGALPIFSKICVALLLLVGFVLFSLQVKFSYLLLAPLGLGVCAGLAFLVRLVFKRFEKGFAHRWIPDVLLVLVIGMSSFHKGQSYLDSPSESTRAVHALASILRSIEPDSDCGVIVAPSFGAAINYLTGCRVSSSTFWGDPCSKTLYEESVRACQGDVSSMNVFQSKMRYRYLVIEMPSSDLATIEALRPLTLFGREYRSVQSAEPLHLLLVDLNRRLTRGTP